MNKEKRSEDFAQLLSTPMNVEDFLTMVNVLVSIDHVPVQNLIQFILCFKLPKWALKLIHEHELTAPLNEEEHALLLEYASIFSEIELYRELSDDDKREMLRVGSLLSRRAAMNIPLFKQRNKTKNMDEKGLQVI